MKTIDLRSDTVTRPSRGMRQAIAQAEVGDDVFEDDPTINKLEQRIADLLGKQAALFVPSGTMSNQLALAVSTQPGDQVILEAGSHIYHYEGGAPAALSGLWPSLIEGERGTPDWDTIQAAIQPANVHLPRPSLVCLENTHNRAGGAVVPLERIEEIGAGVHRHGLKLHLDGARLWNAAVETGIALDRWCAPADTVSVCFSKGLGAPVGSALAGSRESIRHARHVRKRLGGGMRQVGILGAACLYALDHNLDRLAEDHANARRIVESLDHPRIRPVETPQTNIVLLDVDAEIGANALIAALAEAGVACVAFGPSRIRLVTHLDVTEEDCQHAVEILNGLEL